MASRGPKSSSSTQDLEVSRERMKCFKRYFPNSEERTRVLLEYANFSTRSGDFGEFDSIHDRYTMDPKSWWVIHGTCAPMLQSVALKLLVQPSSSSCCERNWSSFIVISIIIFIICYERNSFVHSMRRNKMTPKRAEDLVFIHSNLRLLSRKTPQYRQGETKLWDIAGDSFDSFEDVGMLEVANLSLDEPDLEAVVFTDDGNGVGHVIGDGEDDLTMEIGSNDE